LPSKGQGGTGPGKHSIGAAHFTGKLIETQNPNAIKSVKNKL
jgi:hypothetical protein